VKDLLIITISPCDIPSIAPCAQSGTIDVQSLVSIDDRERQDDYSVHFPPLPDKSRPLAGRRCSLAR